VAGFAVNALSLLALAGLVAQQSQRAAAAGALGFLACCFFGFALNILGVGLGLGGLAQKNRQKIFPALGACLNGGVILALFGLMLFGVHRQRARTLSAALLTPSAQSPAAHWTSDRLLWAGLEAYRGGDFARAKDLLDKYLKANPGHPLQADVSRRLADIDLEQSRDRQLGEAVHAGYAAATVADIVVTPEKFASRRVAFSGLYAGQNLDMFSVWGKFGKGGIVRVDGSQLSVEKKKELLGSLDGFHKVLVKGVCRVEKQRPMPGGGPLSMGVPGMGVAASSTIIRAEDVLDLGRIQP